MANGGNVTHDAGRWPANLIHDGSEEVVGLFPERDGGAFPATQNTASWKMSSKGSGLSPARAMGDSGSAARFFYCAKASKADRGSDNKHPTVKPTDLMRYLCRLVTPPGGLVLDPFTGSGSTGNAAVLEGFRFIGIEREAAYVEIARARIAAVEPKPGRLF
jgi:site-specific DNA-methyltransferase (adenine-specific)